MKSKNILFTLPVAFLFLVASCTQGTKKADEKVVEEETASASTETEVVGDNQLTKDEIEDGWMLLFDGKTSTGWRGYNKETFPAAWKIDDDGTLHIQGSGRGEAGAEDGGDIVYDKMFSDFHFKVDWKVDSAANSGILYRGTEEYDYIWKTGPEMQVLDNAHHPDAKLGKNSNRQSGSLYDLIPANPQNFKGHGVWNTSEVLARGKNIWHIMNGDTVVSYTIGSERMATLIADSKWPELNENWANIPMEGFIALQDHGDDVWFKNIKLREL
jgi:hypothetical protein